MEKQDLDDILSWQRDPEIQLSLNGTETWAHCVHSSTTDDQSGIGLCVGGSNCSSTGWSHEITAGWSWTHHSHRVSVNTDNAPIVMKIYKVTVDMIMGLDGRVLDVLIHNHTRTEYAVNVTDFAIGVSAPLQNMSAPHLGRT